MCVYICVDMPCDFCGWISILVYIYIYKSLFLEKKGTNVVVEQPFPFP